MNAAKSTRTLQLHTHSEVEDGKLYPIYDVSNFKIVATMNYTKDSNLVGILSFRGHAGDLFSTVFLESNSAKIQLNGNCHIPVDEWVKLRFEPQSFDSPGKWVRMWIDNTQPENQPTLYFWMKKGNKVKVYIIS